MRETVFVSMQMRGLPTRLFRWPISLIGARSGAKIGGQARDRSRLETGHGLSCALAVFALLGSVTAKVCTGVFSHADLSSAGPPTWWVDDRLRSPLTAGRSGEWRWLATRFIALNLCSITHGARVERHKPVLR